MNAGDRDPRDGLSRRGGRFGARILAVTAIAVISAGCSYGTIVNTDDAPAPTQVTAPPPPSPSPSTRPSNEHLANAFDYVQYPPTGTSYFFTSPSGTWACAIVPRVKVGCQSATGWPSAMGIAGEPESVLTAAGESDTPNALVVAREGEAEFVALDEPEFALDPEPAKILPFNRILAAAGFRCNVQEQSGVSCLSEISGNGFTFSPDGVAPQYTDVPVEAP